MKVSQAFANVCGVSFDLVYSASYAVICFQCCVLVFSRVGAKDLVLNYNTNLYRGRTATKFEGRTCCSQKQKETKKKKKKHHHSERNNCMNNINEESEASNILISKDNDE